MTKFIVTTINPDNGQLTRFHYDNATSELTRETGEPLVQAVEVTERAHVPAVSRQTPLGKTSPRTLKISLGLSCNYECEYCSQRYVPRAEETNPGDVQAFIDGLDAWVTSPPEKVEFWGGEPLVYIKTMRPLAEAIKAKFPKADLSVITNGTLLSDDINEWLDRMGFSVGISHDGPGQSVRGPDPLQDPQQRSAIMALYARLAPQRRISFNAMVNRKNASRAAIQRFFIELTGDPMVPIGEGSFVDAYDEGGIAHSLQPYEVHPYRSLAFHEIRTGQAANVQAVNSKTASFINSIRSRRPASSLGQKCGMDKSDSIAVDLRGNVLTCQNVSAASTAPNGQVHRIGHVSDLAAVKLDTATHWSKRADCPSCPMLQICQGSCMFLEGPLWDRSCDNAFSDAVPIFAAGIEFLTGQVPVHIEGDFREDRKDIFGISANALDTQGTTQKPVRRPFPIPVVSV
jgi:uncharacterized protein